MRQPRSAVPALVVRHTGQAYPLTQVPTTIGREVGNTIVLADAQVSRRHVTIYWQSGNYVVQDMGSANGTFVNERRIAGPQVLRDGYVIRVGNTLFDVQLPPAAVVGAAPPTTAGYRPGSAREGSSQASLVVGLLVAGIVLVVLILAAVLLIPALQRGEVVAAIQSPLPGAQVALNSELVLQATAGGASDITRLELQVDGFMVAVAASPGPEGTHALAVSQAWTFGQAGPHTVSATAYTARGEASAPASVSIIVVEGVGQATPSGTSAIPGTATPTATTSPSASPEPSGQTPTPTPTPSATPTWTATATPTPTPTDTATPTPTATATEGLVYDLYVRRMDFSSNLIVGETIELSIMIATDIYPSGGPLFPESHFRWRQGPGFPWLEESCPADPNYATCVRTVYLSYTEAGDYYVEVEADSRNQVLETDEGNNGSGWTITVNPRSMTVRFDAFPDGTPISSDLMLSGAEFLADGVRLEGAPAAAAGCGGIATIPAIRRDRFGVTGNFLTTADPADVARCNFGPVGVRFTSPVRRVILTFTGATDTYTLQVFDGAEGLLGVASQGAVAYGDPVQVSFASERNNIFHITLGGPPGAVTAITEIYYEW